jgi:hypothetical protein
LRERETGLTDGEFVGEGEEVKDVDPDVVLLEVVHQVTPVALHLLVGAHSAEHYLGEALRREEPEADPAYRLFVLDQRQRPVLPAKKDIE